MAKQVTAGLGLSCWLTTAVMIMHPSCSYCQYSSMIVTQNISCGETIFGNTTERSNIGGNPSPDDFVLFSVIGGDTRITLSTCNDGTDFDTYLRIHTPYSDNYFVACDDCGADCSVQTTIHLDPYQDTDTHHRLAPEDDGQHIARNRVFPNGEYVLVIEGFQGESGAYELTMDCNNSNGAPTASPSAQPSHVPTTLSPSEFPSSIPSISSPTHSPSMEPTSATPTWSPTVSPTSAIPSVTPTFRPTSALPTSAPSLSEPTSAPSSPSPTQDPTASPSTLFPTATPTNGPTAPYVNVEISGTIECGSFIENTTTDRPNVGGGRSNDIFYYFFAAASSLIKFNTCGSSFDTWIRVLEYPSYNEVYSCDDCGSCGTRTVAYLDFGYMVRGSGSGTRTGSASGYGSTWLGHDFYDEVVNADDDWATPNAVTGALTGGEYVLQIEGFGRASGDFVLEMSCASESPTESPTNLPTSLSPTEQPSALPSMLPTSTLDSGLPTLPPSSSPSWTSSGVSIDITFIGSLGSLEDETQNAIMESVTSQLLEILGGTFNHTDFQVSISSGGPSLIVVTIDFHKSVPVTTSDINMVHSHIQAHPIEVHVEGQVFQSISNTVSTDKTDSEAEDTDDIVMIVGIVVGSVLVLALVWGLARTYARKDCQTDTDNDETLSTVKPIHYYPPSDGSVGVASEERMSAHEA